MKKKCRKKIIVRAIQLIVIIASIVLTKIAINYAFLQRGYKAIGGEYLILVLGLLVVVIIEDIYISSERNKKRRRNINEKNKKL